MMVLREKVTNVLRLAEKNCRDICDEKSESAPAVQKHKEVSKEVNNSQVNIV